MPDFAGLRAAAEDAVRQPDFATVAHRAARLRRRHHIATGAATAVMVLLAAVTAGTTLARSPGQPNMLGGPPGQPNTSAGSPTPRAALPATPHAARPPRLVSATAADTTHLYAIRGYECEQTLSCPTVLYASHDGGRTWQSRGELPTDTPGERWLTITAIGPQVLAGRPWRPATGSQAPSPPGSPNAVIIPPPNSLHVSTDGGRTWRTAPVTTTPIAAVPDGGGLVECVLARQAPQPCTVQALDPGTATVAPLANQPPITVGAVRTLPAATGLWVEGWDPASRKPAVSVSRDAGRTWLTKVFTEAFALPAEEMATREETPHNSRPFTGMSPDLTSLDGRTAYVSVWVDMGNRRVYRTTDGGTNWQITQIRHTDGMITSLTHAFVTPDDAVVVPRKAVGGTAYVASRGGTLQPVTLKGLPAAAVLVAPARGGGYFSYDPDREAMYLSEDGWNYRTVKLP